MRRKKKPTGATLSMTDYAYKATLVVIPAYNAEKSIADVVKKVREASCHLTALVVDDGSADRTALEAEKAGATVVKHGRNLGKGAALRTGFREFLGKDFKAVITLDADGQHSPLEIPKLVEAWLSKRADIVIGTRAKEAGNMPALRIFTNTVSSWLVSLSAGQYIPDSQSGYRLLSRSVVENVETTSKGYGAESEILIKASAAGYKIESAPISTIYEDETSYINPLKQPLLFLGLIFKSFFWRFERLGKRR
jgi:glycosyltransferase involved in cell wall biosynthesis